MTLKCKRKIKSMIAEIIACTLIAIATAVIGLVLIKLASLIVTHITYEQFRQAMIVICIVISIIELVSLFLLQYGEIRSIKN